MEIKNIIVKRGEVGVSDRHILQTLISSCVSVCLYHREFNIGGITHISRSRENDSTPSGRYLKTDGYYYADKAIPRLLFLFKQKYPSINKKNISSSVTGGLNNEGPILETLSELKKHEFNFVGSDINQMLHRTVSFDTASGIVTIERNEPFSISKPTRRFQL